MLKGRKGVRGSLEEVVVDGERVFVEGVVVCWCWECVAATGHHEEW